MFARTLLVALLCACAAADNVTLPRSFPFHYEESLQPSMQSTDDRSFSFDDNNNSTRAAGVNNVRESNKTVGERVISQEAVLFLTGPMSTVVMPSFYTLVCVVSLPVNLFAVVAFVLRIRPKKPPVVYMLNLACADLLFAALLPFKISYHFGGNDWQFGPLLCRVVTAAFYWNMYCSVLLIACISVDRLLAIVYPIASLSWRTQRNAVLACAAMWLLSFACSVPLVLTDQTFHLGQLNITTCHDVLPLQDLIRHDRIYFTALCCVLFFLPLLVTVLSYACVIRSLSRVPRGAVGRSRRKARAVVMVITVLVVFLLCFAPSNCLLLAHYMQFKEDMTRSQEAPNGTYAAYLVFMCVGSMNCLLDPLFYYFGSSQCQRQLSRALRCQKTSGASDITSSRPLQSSSGTVLKSTCTETSVLQSSVVKADSQQLRSQYRKLAL